MGYKRVQMKNITTDLYDRVFKSWKSSLFGCSIILASLVFVWFGKASLIEAGTFITGGVVLFFKKDTEKKNDNGNETN